MQAEQRLGRHTHTAKESHRSAQSAHLPHADLARSQPLALKVDHTQRDGDAQLGGAGRARTKLIVRPHVAARNWQLNGGGAGAGG